MCLLLCLFSGQDGSYSEQINETRSERDLRFGDPLTSPLAQVGGALLDSPQMVFGSSPGADLCWKGEGIEPRHLRVIRESEQIFLEEFEGEVFKLETGERTRRDEWKANEMYRVGSVVLVLREHPVGPIVRILDSQSEEVANFKGLKYFPVNEKYRVKATIRSQPPEAITIVDTQGWKRPARLVGKLLFSVDEVPQQLDLVLFGEEGAEDSGFLVMFRDQTTGKESYPACRYIDLPFQSEGDVWLDFNDATNPSCAYASSFACPLPSPGNHLSVPIRAGEKIYFEKHH